MKLVVTLEIGSTITKANAFELADGLLHHVGQGFAPTSVAAGDVGIGVDAALAAMRVHNEEWYYFLENLPSFIRGPGARERVLQRGSVAFQAVEIGRAHV